MRPAVRCGGVDAQVNRHAFELRHRQTRGVLKALGQNVIPGLARTARHQKSDAHRRVGVDTGTRIGARNGEVTARHRNGGKGDQCKLAGGSEKVEHRHWHSLVCKLLALHWSFGR